MNTTLSSQVNGVTRKKHSFFYGYFIVGAAFVVSLLMWGAYDSFGVFFGPLTTDLGWSRATTAGAFSLAFLVYGFCSVITGRLTDRWGPKFAVFGCGLLLGSGYLMMSRVTAEWQLFLFYGVVMGAGLSGADAPGLATVARWFIKGRGVMTGIFKAGAGIGIMTIPLVMSWVVSSYGWRTAYAWLGVTAMIVIALASLVLKRSPADVGQFPDNGSEAETVSSAPTSPQYSLKEATRTRQFWMFSAAWFILVFSVQMVMGHIGPRVTDVGIPAGVVARVLSTIGAASVVGRVGFGALSDRLGSKRAFTLAIAFLLAALVLILFARHPAVFYVFAALYGIAHGAFFTLISPMLATLFGLRAIGAVIGAVVLMGTVGGGVGAVLAGRVFDVTGNYEPAFLSALVLSSVSLALVMLLGKRATGTGVGGNQ